MTGFRPKAERSVGAIAAGWGRLYMNFRVVRRTGEYFALFHKANNWTGNYATILAARKYTLVLHLPG